jgi:asparagine synthase (glutamine-hydrolysing)
VGTTLSGGLDSGAVATFAARELAVRGERLRAFTAAPLLPERAFTDPKRIGDELPRAQAVAAHAGNIDLQALRSGITPLEGIRRMLAITGEPKDAASNAFWLVDLLATVADAGIGTLLVGRGGNWTISWDGGTSPPLPAPGELPWRDASAINPAFARRLNLAERMRADTGLTGPVDLPSPRDRRLAMLLPGRWNGGCTLAELGAAHGLSLRDPTLDSRVIAFCLRVPDRFFTDPATGEDRQLARRLTKGLLPDLVRLARPRGHQAADLVPRLRASRAEVDACLRRLGAGPTAAYLDLRLMRLVWQEALTVDGPRTSGRATSVLMRGIGVGLFIEQTLAGSDRPFPEIARTAS